MEERGISLISAIIFGIVGVIIAAIIAFTIISTLTGANLLTSGRTTTTTINETNAFINETGYELVNYDSATSVSASLTAIWSEDSGAYNISVPLTNATLSGGTVTNATVTTYSNVSLSYTITTESNEETSSDYLAGNFTEGIDNVSDKIPTVLLVAAIVLILGVMAILVSVWQKMRLGQGGI